MEPNVMAEEDPLPAELDLASVDLTSLVPEPSSIEWRPAEDVLPDEPPPVPATVDNNRVCHLVYARRQQMAPLPR